MAVEEPSSINLSAAAQRSGGDISRLGVALSEQASSLSLTIDEQREQTRSRLAWALVIVVIMATILLIGVGLLSNAYAKRAIELATALVSPLVAILDTVIGFYFGANSNQNTN